MSLPGFAVAQTGPAAMLPSGTDIPGWRQEQGVTVTSLEKLKNTDRTEGALYEEMGFEYRVSAQYYGLKGGIIRVNVDVAENSFGACAIFSRNASGKTRHKEYGNGSYSGEKSYGLWKHLYSVSMETDSAGSATDEGFRQIAAWIDSKIRMRGSIPAISGVAGDLAGDISFFRGKLGLSEVYYFSPLNVFGLTEGMAVQNSSETNIFLKYADNNEAVRRFTEAAGILGPMSKFRDFIMIDEFAWAMKDTAGSVLTFRVEEEYIKIKIRKNK